MENSMIKNYNRYQDTKYKMSENNLSYGDQLNKEWAKSMEQSHYKNLITQYRNAIKRHTKTNERP